MKINIIAEIGLNHLGKEKFLNDYQNTLEKKVHGISIQIPDKSKMKPSHKKYLFTNKQITKFIKSSKKKFKLVGITTSDKEKIDFFSTLNLDFFKVTSGMVQNYDLINKMNKTKVQKIFLSTGMVTDSELKKIFSKIDCKKINLIHTSFEKKFEDINFERIQILKKKFNKPVAYGNHSHYRSAISKSVLFKPDYIFFYVKLNKKLNYPDNIHAIKLGELTKILNDIKQKIKKGN